MLRHNGSLEHVGQNGWLQPCSVGVDQEEKRFFGQDFCREPDEGIDAVLDLPDLPLWPPAVRGRIHDNGVISIAAPYLALHKFHTVVHKPADRGGGEPGRGGIFLCPADHALGGVDMRHMRSGCRGAQRSATRVCEEIEHPDLARGILGKRTLYDRSRPIPVDSLLGEKPCVLEAEGLEMKCEVVVTDIPLLWELEKFPLPAAVRTSVIVSVWFLPAVILSFGIPDHLGVGPYQYVLSPALELFAGGGIDDFIVLPVVCDPHNI